MMEGINFQLIADRAKDIRGNVEKIRNLTRLEKNEFFSDERNFYSLKYLLLECVEAMSIICNHLAAKIGSRAPSSYRECFEQLVELSILSEKSKATLKDMAKFRNLLVHGYWKVNDERVYEYGQNNLSDFEDYLKDIEKFISSLPEQ